MEEKKVIRMDEHGGSQAVFFKINTLGEEAFLDKLIELLDV